MLVLRDGRSSCWLQYGAGNQVQRLQLPGRYDNLLDATWIIDGYIT